MANIQKINNEIKYDNNIIRQILPNLNKLLITIETRKKKITSEK